MALHAEALAKVAATGLAGVFAGASVFITVAQHPALLETDELGFQAPFFRRMYFYAARLQGPMAVASGVSALVVYALQRGRLDDVSAGTQQLWLATGCVMIAITPFTVAKMLRLNHELTNPKLCRSRGQTWLQTTLVRWGQLHRIRTGASVLAFTGMVVAMAYSSTAAQLPPARATRDRQHNQQQLVQQAVQQRHLTTHHQPNEKEQMMWLPHTLLHWPRCLLSPTNTLLRHASHAATCDSALSLARFVDDAVRIALAYVPPTLGGSTMLQTYDGWIAGIVESTTDESPRQITCSSTPEETGGCAIAAAAQDETVESPSTHHEVCERHMYRNDALQHVNRSLTLQVGELESTLTKTLDQLFFVQQHVARLQELDDLRAARLLASERVKNVRRQLSTTYGAVQRANPRGGSLDRQQIDTSQFSGSGVSVNDDDASPDVAETSHANSGGACQSHSLPASPTDTTSHEDWDERPLLANSDTRFEPLDDVGANEYSDLVRLREPEDASWHRRALRRLAHEREQRREARGGSQRMSCSSSTRTSFASSVELDAAAFESESVSYEALVALRDSSADSAIGAWQRESLRCLTRERAQRCSRSSVASSISPTHSSASTLAAFASDE